MLKACTLRSMAFEGERIELRTTSITTHENSMSFPSYIAKTTVAEQPKMKMSRFKAAYRPLFSIIYVIWHEDIQAFQHFEDIVSTLQSGFEIATLPL